MSAVRKDLIGKRRGMLVCTGRLPDRHYVYANCDCGTKGIIVPSSAFYGKGQGAVSCGCVKHNCSAFNRGLNSRNKTGFKGVYKSNDPHKKKKPYSAYLIYHGKQYNLGHYATAEEAAGARKQAEEKLKQSIHEYVEWGMIQ